MNSSTKRVLVSTLDLGGGVDAMAQFVVDCINERGYEPVIAHYEPYSRSPELSVPSFRLGQRRVAKRQHRTQKGHEQHAIGAWFPEFEFTHYAVTRPWKSLIEACDYYVSVSGNALAATPFMGLSLPCVAWVATGWAEDRRDRVARFSAARRLLDSAVTAPVARKLEKRILNSCNVLALSDYTRQSLNAIVGRDAVRDVLPMPVDASLFHPEPERVVPGRIGFSGRLDDPRKNVRLLLEAVDRMVTGSTSVSLDLIGGVLDGAAEAVVKRLGVGKSLRTLPYLAKEQLAEHLRTLDVFVVPSHQEGLCIAALEAMACGCPVVSTRCGGPQEFVIDGETGFLTDADPQDMAQTIARVIADRPLREKLGRGARALIEERYNRETAAAVFWTNFDSVFASCKPVTAEGKVV